MKKLSHLDEHGKARMVDVSGKEATLRRAKASCMIVMSKNTLDLINRGLVAKGDVLTTAKIAGIMAAKRTHELIPMCHPLNISSVNIDFEQINHQELKLTSEVKVEGLTGVEMEALTACAVAALTVYDMAKSAEKGIRIEGLHLEEKEGGKSGHWQKEAK